MKIAHFFSGEGQFIIQALIDLLDENQNADAAERAVLSAGCLMDLH